MSGTMPREINMDQQALMRLRPRTDDCPSDLELDELHAEELDAAVAAKLEAHITACPLCQGRMAAKKIRVEAIPDLDPKSMLPVIKQRAQAIIAAQKRQRFIRRAA